MLKSLILVVFFLLVLGGPAALAVFGADHGPHLAVSHLTVQNH